MQKLLTLSEIKVSYHPVISNNPCRVSSNRCIRNFQRFLSNRNHLLTGKLCCYVLKSCKSCLRCLSNDQGRHHGNSCRCRLLMSVALKIAATSIILCHNHPFRNLKPFMQDLDLTKKIVDAGRYFLIKKKL